MSNHSNQCYQTPIDNMCLCFVKFFFTLKFGFLWQSFSPTSRMFWKWVLLRAMPTESVASFKLRSAASSRFTTFTFSHWSNMHYWCPIQQPADEGSCCWFGAWTLWTMSQVQQGRSAVWRDLSMMETVACPILNQSDGVVTAVAWMAALSAGHHPELN